MPATQEFSAHPANLLSALVFAKVESFTFTFASRNIFSDLIFSDGSVGVGIIASTVAMAKEECVLRINWQAASVNAAAVSCRQIRGSVRPVRARPRHQMWRKSLSSSSHSDAKLRNLTPVTGHHFLQCNPSRCCLKLQARLLPTCSSI